MKKVLITTFVFSCSLLLGACGTQTEKTSKEETTSAAVTTKMNDSTSQKDETKVPDKDSPSTKSSEVFDWFDESGLIRGEKKEIDEYSKPSIHAEFTEYGIVSETFAYVKNDVTPTLGIIEFQTEEDAVTYAYENQQTPYNFLHENFYVVMRVNGNQIENYLKVIKAGKPMKNLERIFPSEEHREINQALKENDFEKIATIYSSIQDWETREAIYYDVLHLSKIKFESVYIGQYKSSDNIFGISPDLYTEPYNDDEKNIQLDGHYLFVHSNYMKKEANPGKKYVIEGYIKSPGTFFSAENSEDYSGSGVWSLIMTNMK